MKCPICPSQETKVVDSRGSENGMTIRRRRECSECGFRFSTHEEMKLLDIKIIKNNGEKEYYNRDKLKQGIVHALTKRPYDKSELNRLIRDIEQDIQKEQKQEIESEQIGKIVMEHLLDFDKVAYLRFASIYREFEDVDKFEREIKDLD
jgi:transcriptional repressor NrdR